MRLVRAVRVWPGRAEVEAGRRRVALHVHARRGADGRRTGVGRDRSRLRAGRGRGRGRTGTGTGTGTGADCL